MGIPTIKNQKNGPYQEWDPKSHGDALASYQRIDHAQASTYEPTRRAPSDYREFERWRPLDAMPTNFHDIVKASRLSYYRFGIVRNVIDLMTDFVCEDFALAHPSKKDEVLLKAWLYKVNMYEVINQFARHLFIDGNAVIKRTTATLTKPVENQWTETAMATSDTKLYVENSEVDHREIPWRYTFLNLIALEWTNTQAEEVIDGPKLGYRVSSSTLQKLKAGEARRSPVETTIINQLPQEVRTNIKNGKTDIVPLDMSRIYVAHNKKDDWDRWAMPYLYSIMADLHYKNKLRQAEMSALDGVINVIRLWKLGDHKVSPRILPTAAGVEKLLGILQANPGGGAIDIVWDSMIEMKDFYPPIDKILGSEKYTQVNKDILIGLGIPDVLLGGEGSNFSNSFIQLKTIVEKLKYIRQIIKRWLYNEIMLFCKGMEISTSPKIKFGQLMDDESTTKKLLVGLLDRGVISVEAVLNAYGEDFLLEIQRIREEKEYLKDAGIKVKSPLEQKVQAKTNGRPPATPDTGKRKFRDAKPRTSMANELVVKGLEAVASIDDNLVPIYMKEIGVSNARKLTSKQKKDVENLRLSVLSCIKPNDSVSESDVISIASDTSRINSDLISFINRSISDFIKTNGTKPTVSQRQHLEALAWASYYNGE